MFALSSSAPGTASSPGLKRRRIVAGIALPGGVALWLWALPALATRDGFLPRGGDPCAQARYRDPLTGQSRPAPSARVTLREACTAAASGGRP